MPHDSRRVRPVLLAFVALAALLASGVLVLNLLAPATDGDGPADLAWDHVVCAHCHMHVGEPAFAAQLRDAEGEVLAFDDPGCLVAWRDAHPSAVTHGVYFHGSGGVGWIPGDQVAFVRHEPTPMGYGWMAVAAGTPGASDLVSVHAALQHSAVAGQPPQGMQEGRP